MTSFIFDELTGIPTILATERAKRVDQTGAVNQAAVKPTMGSKVCFFCKGNESMTPEAVYQDSDNWNVRVFPNRYPLVADHELIVHSPDHGKDLEDLPHEQNVRFIRALLNRVHAYLQQEKEIMIFNNRGGRAGASITHPHSQLVALRGFPGIIEDEKNKALAYYNGHDQCYWCDLVKKELAQGDRVAHESEHFVTLIPKASRWSYEVLLLPKEHKPNFGYINEMEINDFARVLKALLKTYDEMLSKPDRNFWIHTQRFDPYHWHVGFIPHIKVVGGLELGAGIWVSDKATPEDAAKQMGGWIKRFYESETVSIA